MSILYDCIERLKAKSPAEDFKNGKIEEYIVQDYEWLLLPTIKRQIALLCSQVLYDTVGLSIVICINLDGHLTRFSFRDNDEVLSFEIQKAIREIPKAKEVIIDIYYTYLWRTGKDYLGIGPFIFCDLLEELPEEIFNYVDYVMYNMAEGSDGSGIISVYGQRNSILTRGPIDYSTTDEYPSFGEWYMPTLLTSIDDDELSVPNGNLIRVEQICKRLNQLVGASEEEVYVKNGFLYLFFSGPDSKTAAMLKEFIELLAELSTLLVLTVPQEVNLFYVAEYVDISKTGPNQFKIEINYEGEVSLSKAYAFEFQEMSCN